MNFYSENIKVLSAVNPELAKRLEHVKIDDYYRHAVAKDLSPALLAGKKSIHSLYDPHREAARWAGAVAEELKKEKKINQLLVCGFGFGYHIVELLKLLGDCDILVYEPRIEIIKMAADRLELGQIFNHVQLLTSFSGVVNTAEDPAIVMHPGSYNVSGSWFDAVSGHFSVVEKSTALKILVISPIYGGSLPITWYCQRALEENGHTVSVLDFSDFNGFIAGVDKNAPKSKGYFYDKMSSMLSEMALLAAFEFKPNLILSMAQAPIDNQALDKFREAGITTAIWFVEDYNVMEYWKSNASNYDFFFTLQEGEFEEKLKEAGAKNVHCLPLAADPAVHAGLCLSSDEVKEYGSDLSFVGAGYMNRRRFLPQLLDFDFKLWGNEWAGCNQLSDVLQRTGARVSTADCRKIFNATKININLHSSSVHNGVNPFGDYLNPRVFEIASTGRFQLCDERSYMPKSFCPGVDIETFKDIDELKEKASYYLAHPDEAEKIASAGKRLVLRDHTYSQRMKELVGLVCERKPWLLNVMSGREQLKEMIAQAEGDQELVDFLGRFPEEARMSLDDIVEAINNGQGDLTDVETRFLLLNELIHMK